MLFNNGRDRTPSFSEVMIIEPPATIPGFYNYTPNTAFGPTNADYIYEDQSASPSPFYSSIVSSAQRLPNGNTLICEGQFGEIFEIDSNNNKVWEYINPVHNLNGSISSQGDPPPGVNILFRAIKYAPDFPAFTGRDLTPEMPIEINPDISSCLLALSNENFDLSTTIYPVPTQDFINIESTISIDKIEIYTITGSKIIERRNSNKVDLHNLEKGMYLIKIHSKGNTMSKKIIKQ
jgi:hypothetical protein